MTNPSHTGSRAPDALAKLRTRHIELITRSLDRTAQPSFVTDVHEFIVRAAEVGAVLETREERATAQNMLDYWNTSILALSKREPNKHCRSS